MDQRFQLILHNHEISLSELARCSQITPGYLSKIVNGKASNVSLSVLARISERVRLPTTDLLKMLEDKDYLPEAILQKTSTVSQPESIEECIQRALDALESGEQEEFYRLSDQMNNFSSPLQKYYLNWFRGLKLVYENLYAPALEEFSSALQFKARTDVERRFKAKILFGIASIYLGKGDYAKALTLFRRSLITCEAAIHAGTVYLNMGTLNRRNGAYTSAEICYRSALTTPVNYIQLLGYAALGQLYMDQKRLSDARKILLQGYCLTRKSPGDRGKGEIFCNLGKYYKEIGRLEVATKLLKRGLVYTTSPSSKRTRQYLLTELVDVYYISNKSGIEPLIQALQMGGFAEGDILLAGLALITMAKENIKSGHVSEAINLLNQCYCLLAQGSPSEELITCSNLLGNCYYTLREPYQADFFLKEARRFRRLLI